VNEIKTSEIFDEEYVLEKLMQEAYGALGWLQGIVSLSDRARAFKIAKLEEALAEAEIYLTALHTK
jgi:hypothetical protein